MTSLLRAALIGVTVSALVGCATMPSGLDPAQVKDLPLETVMQGVESVAAGGDKQKALALLEAATKANPTASKPWLKMAQMHFEAGNYPAAVVAAEEASKREPGSTEAKSIALVSSLRVAVKYVSDMRVGEKLQGGVRSDAEHLAHKLRETLGEQVLVPTPKAEPPEPRRRASRSARPRATAPAPPPSTEPKSGSANPFGSLKY
jgi:hypothetical protein